MPKRSSSEQPPVMTWIGAAPVLAVAVIADLVRIFFEWFWFFGPAVAAIGANAIAGGGLIGKAAALLAASAAISGGVALEAFGVVMSMATALAGFLAIGILLLMTNDRMFKVNASGWLWLIGSLGVSEIPFIGTFPSFSVALFVLYRRQIKVETAALKRWREEQAAAKRQERDQQGAQFARVRMTQQEQDEEIPDELPAAT